VSNSGREYVLSPDISNKIGRSHSEDIVVQDDLAVSRQNSSIICDKETGVYYISDLDSKYGTRVNGEKIACNEELKNGDIIEIGKFTKFVFQLR